MVYGRTMQAEVALDTIISRTDLEPCEHEFPRRELGLAYLVSHNERPYQTQDQLQIAVHDVHVTWKSGEIDFSENFSEIYVEHTMPER